ncbi:MAG: hypothetical protein IT258_01535 [Saprospiraceae bacterium]|nr:hypothetical protein [Saprospiraceae bacterium]
MKKVLTVSLSLIFSLQCIGQVGIIAGYKTFNAPGFNDGLGAILDDTPYPIGGWQAGLDYWFRLKKRRIEFMPELAFSRYVYSIQTSKMDLKQVGFHFNTAFYIFDLASDCNCPTFSKDGNMFGKGFFIELSPGLVYMNNKVEGEFLFEPFYTKNSWAPGGSIGAGLDLGFSDLFTITPIARLHYYPGVYSLAAFEPAEKPETDLRQFFIGLRFRLHFKEIAKARYR